MGTKSQENPTTPKVTSAIFCRVVFAVLAGVILQCGVATAIKLTKPVVRAQVDLIMFLVVQKRMVRGRSIGCSFHRIALANAPHKLRSSLRAQSKQCQPRSFP